MSKNPSERNRMPGEGEDLDREKKPRKEGDQQKRNPQDVTRDQGQGQKGQQGRHQQGEPLNPQKGPKPSDPNRQWKPGEDADDKKRRPA